jgi:aerobic carbon-monoxide dehydrogenase medium subunit
VGDGPVEATEAARMLVGERPTPERIEAAAAHAAEKEIDPHGDIHASAAFKRHLARVLTRRALLTAVDRAGDPRAAAAERVA